MVFETQTALNGHRMMHHPALVPTAPTVAPAPTHVVLGGVAVPMESAFPSLASSTAAIPTPTPSAPAANTSPRLSHRGADDPTGMRGRRARMGAELEPPLAEPTTPPVAQSTRQRAG